MKRKRLITDMSYQNAFYCLLGMAYLAQAVAEEQRRIAEQAQLRAQQQSEEQQKKQFTPLSAQEIREVSALFQAKQTDPQNDALTDPV